MNGADDTTRQKCVRMRKTNRQLEVGETVITVLPYLNSWRLGENE